MASDPITSWDIDGETVETVADFILFLAPKSLQTVTAATKLRHLLLGRKAITNLDSILKSILKRHCYVAKVCIVKAMVFTDVRVGP